MPRFDFQLHYRTLFLQVREILCRTDPMGICWPEENPDEYDPEVATILPRLSEASSAEDVQRIVYQQFVRWFGDAGSEGNYADCAREIWALWQDYID